MNDMDLILSLMRGHHKDNPLPLYSLIFLYDQHEKMTIDYDYLVDILKVLYENNKISQNTATDFYLCDNGLMNTADFINFTKDDYNNALQAIDKIFQMLEPGKILPAGFTEKKLIINFKLSGDTPLPDENIILNNFTGNLFKVLNENKIAMVYGGDGSRGWIRYVVYGATGDDTTDLIHELISGLFDNIKEFEGSYLTKIYSYGEVVSDLK